MPRRKDGSTIVYSNEGMWKTSEGGHEKEESPISLEKTRGKKPVRVPLESNIVFCRGVLVETGSKPLLQSPAQDSGPKKKVGVRGWFRKPLKSLHSGKKSCFRQRPCLGKDFLVTHPPGRIPTGLPLSVKTFGNDDREDRGDKGPIEGNLPRKSPAPSRRGWADPPSVAEGFPLGRLNSREC